MIHNGSNLQATSRELVGIVDPPGNFYLSSLKHLSLMQHRLYQKRQWGKGMECWGVEKFCIFSNKVTQKLLIQCALNTDKLGTPLHCVDGRGDLPCQARGRWGLVICSCSGWRELYLLCKNDIGITKLHRLEVWIHRVCGKSKNNSVRSCSKALVSHRALLQVSIYIYIIRVLLKWKLVLQRHSVSPKPARFFVLMKGTCPFLWALKCLLKHLQKGGLTEGWSFCSADVCEPLKVRQSRILVLWAISGLCCPEQLPGFSPLHLSATLGLRSCWGVPGRGSGLGGILLPLEFLTLEVQQGCVIASRVGRAGSCGAKAGPFPGLCLLWPWLSQRSSPSHSPYFGMNCDPLQFLVSWHQLQNASDA